MYDINNYLSIILALLFIANLAAIYISDKKEMLVSDLFFIILLPTHILFFENKYQAFENILIFLGLTLILKVIIENIIFIYSRGENEFEFGNADIYLIGILSADHTFLTFSIFLYAIFMIFGFTTLYKFIRSKKKSIKINTAFIPYIIWGYIISQSCLLFLTL